jgi:predicted aspartyl protease
MGFVEDEIELIGHIKSKKLLALFDTGADANYIRKRFLDGDSIENIGYIAIRTDYAVEHSNGEIDNAEAVAFIRMNYRVIKAKKPVFIINPAMGHDVILGADFMQTHGIILDPKCEKAYFG